MKRDKARQIEIAYLFHPLSPCLIAHEYNRGRYSWYYTTSATCGRMCMPERPRGLSRTNGTDRIRARRSWYCPIRDSSRAIEPGFIGSYTRSPLADILARRYSLYIDSTFGICRSASEVDARWSSARERIFIIEYSWSGIVPYERCRDFTYDNTHTIGCPSHWRKNILANYNNSKF